jgi:hypothetical protein
MHKLIFSYKVFGKEITKKNTEEIRSKLLKRRVEQKNFN